MICAALGALVVLIVSAVLWPSERNGSGVGASGNAGAMPAPVQVFDAKAGTCLNWTEPDASDTRQVTCREPHLFEVSGKADLRADFGATAPFPDTEQWQQLKLQRCTPVSAAFLHQRFDPEGRFSVGAFTPSEQGWAGGDRTLHCGVQQPGSSGKLYRVQGPVSKLDQSDTYPAGRCLGISGTDVADPVDCAQPHSVEVTGRIDLAERFPAGYPPESEQDGYLSTRCEELTAQYAGSPAAAADKGLVTYWDTLEQPSWDAGSRQVNCKVSAQLPSGDGLAPITGSVKGEVEVADEPAPTDPTPIDPAVPADGMR